MPVNDLCRENGFAEASYYLRRSKFGGMSASDAKRLNELEIREHSAEEAARGRPPGKRGEP